MKANSLKYYHGTLLYKQIRDIAELATCEDWHNFFFLSSDDLHKILIGKPRPRKNKEFWDFQNTIKKFSFRY